MNTIKHYQLVVVGAGPGGMAAAVSASRCGLTDILILERRNYLGGILPQCIHDGFGLYLYHQSLTGPEYAARWGSELMSRNIQIQLCATALDISKVDSHEENGVNTNAEQNSPWQITYLGKEKGIVTISAESIILATGCREKTLAQLHIPGSRPAGIYTAGAAQYMMNIQNYLPGKSAVILGSGDIGLIMARRMTLEGIHVKLILGQNSTGLVRNLVQCVEDFQLPIQYGFTIASVHGYKRLKGVTIAPVTPNGEINLSHKQYIPCDTLLIAAGLIPELDLCRDSGLIDETEAYLSVNEQLCIGHKGIFACGNAVKVHDLADSVTYEGQKAGVEAAKYVLDQVIIPMDLEKQIQIQVSEPKGLISRAHEKNIKTKNKPLTCILCPKGCQIQPSQNTPNNLKTKVIYDFTGYCCEKGRDYALEEVTDPKRTVTTSVKINGADHPLLAVRTDRPISKATIPLVMKIVKKIVCNAPIKLGTILMENIDGTGANLISANEALSSSEVQNDKKHIL